MDNETLRQGRFVETLERLLAVQVSDLDTAMNQAAHLLAETLAADKVDAFIYEPDSHTLVAVGTSDTPMGRKQKSLGLDRLPIANGGRIVQVFESRTPHLSGKVDQDPLELQGVKQGLEVGSEVAAPLEIGGETRGVLLVCSSKSDFFSEADLRFVEAVSRWVGLVAHRAELVEETTRQAAQQGRRMVAEEMVTVLAHDLRNLLAPLKGWIDIIERRARREDRQEDVRAAGEASRSLRRANNLISDLMDAGRLEQGIFEVQPDLVDLVPLVHAAAASFGSPDRDIRVETPKELLVPVHAQRFVQALENLVVNAVQHSPQGTNILVKARTSVVEGDKRVLVTVSNQGPAIPSEEIPVLFDRFVSGNRSRGLGLGLYIANGIVRAHAGKLNVESTPEMTCFTMVLPAEPGADPH